MPTQKPRTMITFNDEELFKMVDEFRFENRYKSQNEAIMALIDRGIEVLLHTQTAKPVEKLSEEDKRVLNAYRAADPIYKTVAIELLETHPAKIKKGHA